MNVRVRFMPRYCWIGAYFGSPDYGPLEQRTFICLLPCLPIIITRRVKAYE